MEPVDLNLLIKAIPFACRPDTTQSVWDPERPVTGHCVLASVLTQSFFGGTIARALMSNDVTHYWNVLPSGAWLDTTRSQFDDDVYPTYVLLNPKISIYWFNDTLEKYQLFTERFWQTYREMKSRPSIAW